MRKPRDIDAELQALADRAKSLKARKLVQLGELVVATGADRLEPEVLAGALLSAAETRSAETLAQFGKTGARFFQRESGDEGPAAGPGSDRPGRTAGPGGAASS